MSLLESLKAKAVKEISDEEQQKEWVETGFDAAIKEGHKLLPSDLSEDDAELKAVRESGEFALAKLEKHKGALVKLVGDPILQSRLGANGRQRAEQKYSVDNYVALLDGLYCQLAGIELPSAQVARTQDSQN